MLDLLKELNEEDAQNGLLSTVFEAIGGQSAEAFSKTTAPDSQHESAGADVAIDNYPNPFNPITTITYTLPVEGPVVLKVYDVMGREVATLVREHQLSGTHAVRFDASHLSSGVYIYQLKAASGIITGRMLLVK